MVLLLLSSLNHSTCYSLIKTIRYNITHNYVLFLTHHGKLNGRTGAAGFFFDIGQYEQGLMFKMVNGGVYAFLCLETGEEVIYIQSGTKDANHRERASEVNACHSFFVSQSVNVVRCNVLS